MAILSKIRRWDFREHVAIRKITNCTALSRNTIRNYLRNAVVEPQYSERRSPSKLDAFADKLAQWLFDELRTSREQRRSLKQIHSDLCALGFTGSYDRVSFENSQMKVFDLR